LVSWGELQGLDFAVAEAKRLGIRLILSLVNGNPSLGGKKQYVDWALEYAGIHLPDEDSFFTDPTIMSWYKNFVKVNSIATLASCSIS
jgi:mannan endo-1,4-beta-mannosidase